MMPTEITFLVRLQHSLASALVSDFRLPVRAQEKCVSYPLAPARAPLALLRKMTPFVDATPSSIFDAEKMSHLNIQY
jgi:hypothetical protein